MKNKQILILGLIFVTILGALILYKYQQQENPSNGTDGQVETVLTELRQTVDADFTEPTTVEFQWYIASNSESGEPRSTTISGLQISASNQDPDYKIDIYRFFSDRGFEYNILNVVSNITQGQEGHQKDDLICIASEQADNLDDGEIPFFTEGGTYIYEVSCGVLE